MVAGMAEDLEVGVPRATHRRPSSRNGALDVDLPPFKLCLSSVCMLALRLHGTQDPVADAPRIRVRSRSP